MFSPKVALPKTTTSEDKSTGEYVEAALDIAKYGYGEAVPDSEKYGYWEATPSSDERRTSDASKYGYGIAEPDPKPASRRRSPMARRSSLKGGSGPERTRSLRRRATMGPEFEIQLPGQDEPVRRRRSITFNEGVVVRKIKPVSALTKNPAKLWFQDDEMETIKRQIAKIVKEQQMYSETHDSEDSAVTKESQVSRRFCTRGLERMLDPEAVKVKRFHAWDSVLNEQYLQRQDGEFDDEALAAMYRLSTRRSSRDAVRRASEDAEEIESYLESTAQLCRRMSIQ